MELLHGDFFVLIYIYLCIQECPENSVYLFIGKMNSVRKGQRWLSCCVHRDSAWSVLYL